MPYQLFFAPYDFFSVFALFTHLGCAAYWQVRTRSPFPRIPDYLPVSRARTHRAGTSMKEDIRTKESPAAGMQLAQVTPVMAYIVGRHGRYRVARLRRCRIHASLPSVPGTADIFATSPITPRLAHDSLLI